MNGGHRIPAAAGWIALLLPMALLLWPPSPCPGYSSARISSLGGGYVSGIIPDYLTDLHLNPAYGALADRAALHYGFCSETGYLLLVPVRREFDFRLGYYTETKSISHRIQSVTAYGIGTGGIRFTLNARWSLENTESYDPEQSRYIQPPNSLRINSISNYNKDDREYAELSLGAAWKLGGGSSIGVRAGNRRGYISDTQRYLRKYDDYEIADDPFDIFSDRTDKNDDLNDDIVRKNTYYLEAGLLGVDAGRELTVRIARHDQFFGYDEYDLRILKRFNSTGEISAYEYHISETEERKEGVLWEYGFTARYTLSTGLVFFAAASWLTGDYDVGWSSLDHYISWADFASNEEQRLLGRQEGGGELDIFSITAKAGKTVAVMEGLDLTPALYASFGRTEAGESYPTDYSLLSLSNSQSLRLEWREPYHFDKTVTKASAALPLALEYRPCDYFTFFTSYVLDAFYSKTEYDVTSVLAPGMLDDLPYGDNGWNGTMPASEEQVVTRSVAVAGFSLRYRERLRIDIYMQSHILPPSYGSVGLDALYAF